jgi:hypothetical protein
MSEDLYFRKLPHPNLLPAREKRLTERDFGDWIPDQVGNDKGDFCEPQGDPSLRSGRD